MFPNTRDLTVIRLHEAAVLMLLNATCSLNDSEVAAFESAIKAAAPSSGYALECLAKLAFIVEHFVDAGEVPSDEEIRSFANGIYHLKGDAKKSMAGHHVDRAIHDLIERHPDTFGEVQSVLAEPFHVGVLRAVTAFHAFTRYAWVNDLRGDDREISFDAAVFNLQRIHLADQPPEMRSVAFDSRRHHEATFLPRVADALTDLGLALSLGLWRSFDNNEERVLATSVIRHLVRTFPEQLRERTGASPEARWGDPISGSWGTYRL